MGDERSETSDVVLKLIVKLKLHAAVYQKLDQIWPVSKVLSPLAAVTFFLSNSLRSFDKKSHSPSWRQNICQWPKSDLVSDRQQQIAIFKSKDNFSCSKSKFPCSINSQRKKKFLSLLARKKRKRYRRKKCPIIKKNLVKTWALFH